MHEVFGNKWIFLFLPTIRFWPSQTNAAARPVQTFGTEDVVDGAVLANLLALRTEALVKSDRLRDAKCLCLDGFLPGVCETGGHNFHSLVESSRVSSFFIFGILEKWELQRALSSIIVFGACKSGSPSRVSSISFWDSLKVAVSRGTKSQMQLLKGKSSKPCHPYLHTENSTFTLVQFS